MHDNTKVTANLACYSPSSYLFSSLQDGKISFKVSWNFIGTYDVSEELITPSAGIWK
jgi:hypothetical protein